MPNEQNQRQKGTDLKLPINLAASGVLSSLAAVTNDENITSARHSNYAGDQSLTNRSTESRGPGVGLALKNNFGSSGPYMQKTKMGPSSGSGAYT